MLRRSIAILINIAYTSIFRSYCHKRNNQVEFFAFCLSYLIAMTSLYKAHNAFILIYAKLCGPLKKAPSPTTGPWPTS